MARARGASLAWASSSDSPPTDTSRTVTPGLTRFQLDISKERALEPARTISAARPIANAKVTDLGINRVHRVQPRTAPLLVLGRATGRLSLQPGATSFRPRHARALRVRRVKHG